MWDDRVYRRALKFIRFSLLGIVILWVGAGTYNIILAVIGIICTLILFLTGFILIVKMVWTEDKDENLQRKTR